MTTDNSDIAQQVRMSKNHGLVNRNTVEKFASVSRMDTLQAAILVYRLSHLTQTIEKRRNNADLYRSLLDLNHVYIPEDSEEEFNSYHTFVIQCEKRYELQRYLMEHGIETTIHYPVPIHLQPAAATLGYNKGDFPATETQSERILTLPIHQYLQEDTIIQISSCINTFFN